MHNIHVDTDSEDQYQVIKMSDSPDQPEPPKDPKELEKLEEAKIKGEVS